MVAAVYLQDRTDVLVESEGQEGCPTNRPGLLADPWKPIALEQAGSVGKQRWRSACPLHDIYRLGWILEQASSVGRHRRWSTWAPAEHVQA